MPAIATADAVQAATAPLAPPDWLARVSGDPAYRWALDQWNRAAAQPGAWFDHAKADTIVERWPKIFRLTDDRFKGVPFRLLPWQEITVRMLVGWKKPVETLDPATHRPTVVHVRLFRRLDLWIPRKNGKSEFLAALAVLFFVLESVPGGQGYVFGRNIDQGRIPFAKMRAIIQSANGLVDDRQGNARISFTARGIFIRSTQALCELLTGKPDGKHGRSPTVIVGDEIHEWFTRELADTLRQGTGTRLQPIELYASTAGRKSNLTGWEWYQESVGILEGLVDDPSTLIVHFAVSNEDDWTDETTWRKANPSLGLTPTFDYLRTEFRKAKGRPVQEALFKCYHLNLWVDQVGGWLTKSKWDACTVDPEGWQDALKRYRGRRAFGALDVSATRDITALVWCFEPTAEDPKWGIVPRFWVPEATLDERAEQDRRVNWRGWVRQGALETTPGDFVDQNFVLRAIFEGLKDFEVTALGYDSWNAQKLVGDAQAEGVAAELFAEMRQGHRTLGEPTKLFERLVYAGQIEHGGHPVLAWMASHCRVRFDQNLNYVPDKKGSLDKIDGIVAAVMGVGLSLVDVETIEPAPWEDPNFKMVV
jgi:phage terminase large subunit-like protein